MFRAQIRKEIEKVIPAETNFSVAASDNQEHGDYSSNVALVVAKIEGKNPKEVAEKIKSKLLKKTDFQKIIERIEIAGPGFLNFFIAHEVLIEKLSDKNFRWFDVPFGTSNATRHFKSFPLARGAKKFLDESFSILPKRINIEFISANPTGLLHIGHGRGAFYGDVLGNILKAVGHKVDREYFINDSKESAQIKELGKTALGQGEQYKSNELSKIINKLKSRLKKTIDIGGAGYLVSEEFQKKNKKLIEKLNIKFSKWFSEEKELRSKKTFKKILELLKKENLLDEKDGALWAKTKEFGDDENRVIVRSQTLEPTYFLSDIAYHDNKFKRGYDLVINIWGADHQGHVKRIEAMKKALRWKGELKIFISQLVTLKGGKLSKRAGNIVYLEDLYNAVGLDAVRWFFLERSLNTHMDFDLDLARERSKKNPVYYVQYAHARACSILRNGGKGGKVNLELLNESEEFSLIKKILQLPEIIEDISNDYQVNRLPRYTYELAQTFTSFYEKHKVIDEKNKELTKVRLYLVLATEKTLKSTLGLMGIVASEKM